MKNYFIRKESEFIYFVELKKEFYEPKAIMYAADMFTEQCYVKIDEVDAEKLEDLLGEFCNEALKKQVQIDLEERFGKLREIIYRKAFERVGGIE